MAAMSMAQPVRRDGFCDARTLRGTLEHVTDRALSQATSALVRASAFGARLDALRTELGLETRTKGKEVFFVGLKLAS